MFNYRAFTFAALGTVALLASSVTARSAEAETPAEGSSRRQQHRAPPPEAFTACEGKAADAACTVTFGDRTIEGTCRTPPPDSGETRLVCFPARPPGGPGPGPDR